MAAPAWSSGMQPLSWVPRRAGPEPAPRLSLRGGSRRLRRAAAPRGFVQCFSYCGSLGSSGGAVVGEAA